LIVTTDNEEKLNEMFRSFSVIIIPLIFVSSSSNMMEKEVRINYMLYKSNKASDKAFKSQEEIGMD